MKLVPVPHGGLTHHARHGLPLACPGTGQNPAAEWEELTAEEAEAAGSLGWDFISWVIV